MTLSTITISLTGRRASASMCPVSTSWGGLLKSRSGKALQRLTAGFFKTRNFFDGDNNNRPLRTPAKHRFQDRRPLDSMLPSTHLHLAEYSLAQIRCSEFYIPACFYVGLILSRGSKKPVLTRRVTDYLYCAFIESQMSKTIKNIFRIRFEHSGQLHNCYRLRS